MSGLNSGVEYGKFYDFGYYSGAEYAGHRNLTPGYWVYVAPNWHIWKDSKKPAAAIQRTWFLNLDDPFSALVGKNVQIRVGNQTIVGAIIKNHRGDVLLEQTPSKTGVLLNKAHIAYLQWSK